ncbi:MAG: hypothetical protein CMO61_08650 [Verrucomicrobiales bacterium]|nr:hypothetical protein [Verrucomicrobiales bacterium]
MFLKCFIEDGYGALCAQALPIDDRDGVLVAGIALSKSTRATRPRNVNASIEVSTAVNQRPKSFILYNLNQDFRSEKRAQK